MNSEQDNELEAKTNKKLYRTDFSDIQEIKALSISTAKKEELPNLKGDYKIKRSYASTDKNYYQLGALDYEDSLRKKKKSEEDYEVSQLYDSKSRVNKKLYQEKDDLGFKEDSLDYIVFSKLIKGSERMNFVRNKGKVNSRLRPNKKHVINTKKRKQIDNFLSTKNNHNNYFQNNIQQHSNVHSENLNNTMDKLNRKRLKDSKDFSINS